MTRPSRQMVLPTGLDASRNGLLFPVEMRPVFLPGIGMGSMQPKAAQAWDCLAMYFHLETGMTLTQSSRGYRTFDEQFALFHQRFTDSLDVNELASPLVTRIVNGVQYHLRRNMALAATPGRSNHGLGLAADAAYWREWTLGQWRLENVTSNQWAMGWLETHAPEFGFYWNVPSEPWHLEYCPGDEVPQRITDTMHYLGQPLA